MRDYVLKFCREFDMPQDAETALMSAYDVILRNKSIYEKFTKMIADYICNDDVFVQLDEISKFSGVHKYTGTLLYYVCLSKQTRILYAQKGIPDEIYHDSMSDLKWKSAECHKLHGIWGAFTTWFNRFFDITRFALGRLQFETAKFAHEYEKNGYRLCPNDLVLNIHIPSSGALCHEDCLMSYKKAAEFFKEYFINRPTAFMCNSWLLFPKHKEMLSASSNIRKFMDDFDIIANRPDDTHHDLWRIFNTPYTGDISSLPRETALQKAYYDLLEKGEMPGIGYGVFFFENGKIL